MERSNKPTKGLKRWLRAQYSQPIIISLFSAAATGAAAVAAAACCGTTVKTLMDIVNSGGGEGREIELRSTRKQIKSQEIEI